MEKLDREQKQKLIKKGQLNLMTVARALGKSRLARLAVVPLWSMDPFGANRPTTQPANLASARGSIPVPTGAPPSSLTIMSWNIKYGGGRIDFFYDGHGERVLMREEEVRRHMTGISEAIRVIDPDILFIQEIDVCSKRSARIDQLRWLLEHTDLSFAAYAPQWKIGWLPSRGLGALDTGIAILSKYPLARARRLALPLIDEQDGLTQYFFLRRCSLTAQALIPGHEPLSLVCAHTSAFASGSTKRWQFDTLMRDLEQVEEGGARPMVFGGDFNIPPPGASNLHDFEDCVPVEEEFLASDFRGQTRWLEPLFARYNPSVPLARYMQDEASFFSHTTDGRGFWNRKLDYLFSNREWVEGSGQTHQSEEVGGVDTMPLSDHAPVSAVLAL